MWFRSQRDFAYVSDLAVTDFYSATQMHQHEALQTLIA